MANYRQPKSVPVVESKEYPLSSGSGVQDVRMSVGNLNSKGYPAPESAGIKTRGNGAATKGTKARGPMA
jgi:hypothetical protein